MRVLALCLLLLCVPAQAQQMTVTTVLVCDTPTQIERFIELGGNKAAIELVNDEMKLEKNSCIISKLAFFKGEKVGQVTNSAGSFDIVEITVFGSIKDNMTTMLKHSRPGYTLIHSEVKA